jgi:hypothetical protein
LGRGAPRPSATLAEVVDQIVVAVTDPVVVTPEEGAGVEFLEQVTYPAPIDGVRHNVGHQHDAQLRPALQHRIARHLALNNRQRGRTEFAIGDPQGQQLANAISRLLLRESQPR